MQYPTIYDPKTDSYLIANSSNATNGWCEVACTLGAMAIAASDGPVPIMDALAIAYGIACLADCQND